MQNNICLHFLGDSPTLPDIVGEEVTGEADPGGVGQLQSFFFSLELDDGDDWAEDLLLEGGHIRFQMRQDCRTEVQVSDRMLFSSQHNLRDKI